MSSPSAEVTRRNAFRRLLPTSFAVFELSSSDRTAAAEDVPTSATAAA